MLVLIDPWDALGPRVLPPFDGLVPGAPKSGPLLELGGKRYDVFLTFGAVGPGVILETGQPLVLSFPRHSARRRIVLGPAATFNVRPAAVRPVPARRHTPFAKFVAQDP